MDMRNLPMQALRLACLLIAAYLALRGIAYVAPKVSEAARHLLDRL